MTTIENKGFEHFKKGLDFYNKQDINMKYLLFKENKRDDFIKIFSVLLMCIVLGKIAALNTIRYMLWDFEQKMFVYIIMIILYTFIYFFMYALFLFILRKLNYVIFNYEEKQIREYTKKQRRLHGRK